MSKFREKFKKFKESKVGQNLKESEIKTSSKKTAQQWVLTVSRDCLTTPPLIEQRFVTSCGNATRDDVMEWWNRTYFYNQSEEEKFGNDYRDGAPQCIDVKEYQPEQKDWIVMPTVIHLEEDVEQA